MDGFKAALGVKCSFCHAPSKDTAQKWPDFASDEKPEKGYRETYDEDDRQD